MDNTINSKKNINLESSKNNIDIFMNGYWLTRSWELKFNQDFWIFYLPWRTSRIHLYYYKMYRKYNNFPNLIPFYHYNITLSWNFSSENTKIKLSELLMINSKHLTLEFLHIENDLKDKDNIEEILKNTFVKKYLSIHSTFDDWVIEIFHDIENWKYRTKSLEM